MRKIIPVLVLSLLVPMVSVKVEAQDIFYGGAPGILTGYGQRHPNQKQTLRLETNRDDIGPTLARNLPWAGLLAFLGHKYIGLKERELKVEGGYAVVKMNGRDVMVHRNSLGLYDAEAITTTTGISARGPTATYAVVPDFYGPRVESRTDYYGGSRDPYIEEMEREARRLEREARAIERYTDAQTDLKKARQYREERRPVAAVRPVSDGDDRLGRVESKLDRLLNERSQQSQEQKIVPAPVTPSEKEVPLSSLENSGFGDEWIKNSLPDPYDPGFEKTPPESHSRPSGVKLVSYSPGPYGKMAPVYPASR